MKRRGFTAIELAIVVSISALLVPLVFLTARSWDVHRAAGLRHVAAAEEVMTVGEVLRADRRVKGKGGCGSITYAVTDQHTFVRRGCGEEAALATHVESAEHVEGGWALVFGFEARPGEVEHTNVFIPVAD